jgi:hypothetical protein
VASGTTITAPTAPTKTASAGLYSGTLIVQDVIPAFVEWRRPNGTAWNFATDTVTANITLTAHWSASNPIAGVAANDLSAAFVYLNAAGNPDGQYTLVINQDITTVVATGAGARRLTRANRHLTIIGMGAERKIQPVQANDRIFSVEIADSSLTLGENITLQGRNDGTVSLVSVITAGNFIMKNGSKIIGATYAHGDGGVVSITGAGSVFTMEGGEISGNTNTGTASDVAGVRVVNGTFIMSGGTITNNITASTLTAATGGVFIGTGATFTMSGGTITGNLRNTDVAADVLIRNNAASFTSTGGTIGNIVNNLP